MKKFLFFIFLIVVGLFLTVYLALPAILKAVIGAPVSITHIQLSSSKMGIYGLKIGNPEGFQEKQMASIPEISVQYDLGALFKGKVHLQRVHITIDEVTIERNGKGQFNLTEIKALKKSEKGTSQASLGNKPQSGSNAKPLPLQIDEVVLDVDKARFVYAGSVKQFSMGVKNQTFHHVTHAPTLIREIVFFILKKVGMSAFPDNLDALLKGVSGEAGSTVGKWMNKLAKL